MSQETDMKNYYLMLDEFKYDVSLFKRGKDHYLYKDEEAPFWEIRKNKPYWDTSLLIQKTYCFWKYLQKQFSGLTHKLEIDR